MADGSLKYEAILDASKFEGGLGRALTVLGQLDTKLGVFGAKTRATFAGINTAASQALNVKAFEAGTAALGRVGAAAQGVRKEVQAAGAAATQAAAELKKVQLPAGGRMGGGLVGNLGGFLGGGALAGAGSGGGGDGGLGGIMAVAGRFAGPVAAATAAWQGLKMAIGSAAQMESTQAAFEALTGSAATAGKVLGELRQLGAETPFEFPELADAGRKLIAFGEGADTVAGTLRRIGDVASGIQQPIGEIAEIYGKARVQGTLFAEDINQLTGRGIPVIQEFAKQLGVSEGEVKKLGSEGKITFSMLEQAFIDMTSTGGKFAGMMEKQSQTLSGQWSNFLDVVGEVARMLGEPLITPLKALLQGSADVLKTWGDVAQVLSGVKSLADAIGERDPARAAAQALGRQMDEKLAAQAAEKAAAEGKSTEEQEAARQAKLAELARQREARGRLGISDDFIGGLMQKHMLGRTEDDEVNGHRGIIDDITGLFGSEEEIGAKLRQAAEAGKWEEAERLKKAMDQLRASRKAVQSHEAGLSIFRHDPKVWEKFEPAAGSAPGASGEAATASRAATEPLERMAPGTSRAAAAMVAEEAPEEEGNPRRAKTLGLRESTRRRAKTLGLSESTRRRWDRMSEADKAKYGGHYNRWLNSQPMLRGRVRPEVASQLEQGGAPQVQARATRRSRDSGTGGGSASSLLEKIERNTAAMAKKLESLTAK